MGPMHVHFSLMETSKGELDTRSNTLTVVFNSAEAPSETAVSRKSSGANGTQSTVMALTIAPGQPKTKKGQAESNLEIRTSATDENQGNRDHG